VIDIEALHAALRRQHEALPFSGVVHIREGSETVFSQAWGYADKAEQRPNLIDTRFAVASGSKTFTAAAICQLVERGKLAFDTRLADCLDIAFPRFDPAVTVHHLLTHTSGIPDYFDEDVSDDYEALWTQRPMYAIRTPADFLPLFQHLPMKFAPGEKFHYNNAGYIVLGLIVEQASGMPFADYVQRHIFDVCGMSRSGYYATDQLPAGSAYGYIEDGSGGWRTNFFAVPIVGGPDGGVFVTAPDMGRYWSGLQEGRIVSREMVERMIAVQGQSKSDAYGYGLWLRLREGRVHVYHAEGADPGAAFLSGVVPSRGIDFAVLGNTGDATWPVAKIVLDAVE